MSYVATSSGEASARINSARMRDMTFAIRRTLRNQSLPDEDIEMLAEIVLHLLDDHSPLNPSAVEAALLQRGRSRHKSEELTRALFP